VRYDLGIEGLGWLVAMSLAFGIAAQFVGRSATPWLWLVAAVGWFAGGLFMSEVVFGTATVDEIQPIINGLALDESMLGGLLVGVPTVVVARYLTGSSPFRRRTSA
jgi:hypothetical protein